MTNDKSSVWKDLPFILLPFILFPVTVFIGQKIGWIPVVSGKGWLILFGGMIAVASANMFGTVSSPKKDRFHRVGYELCAMSLGTGISLFSAQLISPVDLIPGFSKSFIGILLMIIPGGVIIQRLGFFALMTFFSFLTLGINARIVCAVENEKPSYGACLQFISYCIGSAMLFLHISALMGK